MWPWGHLAVAYLLLTLVTHRWLDRPPRGTEAIAVGGAALLPDLIDKPLAWSLNILPNGRSLGHSLLIALLVIAVLGWYFNGRHDGLTMAVAVGWLSHLATDGVQPLVTGEWQYLGYLGWPLIPALDYPERHGILAHFASLELTPWLGLELLLVVLSVIAWHHDGRPWPSRLSLQH